MDKSEQLSKDLFQFSFLLRDRIKAVDAHTVPRSALARIASGGGLHYEISDSDLRTSIDNFWSQIQGNKGLSWCKRQKDIAAAFDLLHAFHKEMNLSARATEIRRLTLYESVSFWTGLAFKDPAWKPDTITLNDKNRAIQAASELIEFLDRSRSWPKKPRESKELSSTLSELRSDLSQPAVRGYSGPKARQKFILSMIAANLRGMGFQFDSHIVQLIEHIGKPMGFEPNQRTLARYVKNSKP